MNHGQLCIGTMTIVIVFDRTTKTLDNGDAGEQLVSQFMWTIHFNAFHMVAIHWTCPFNIALAMKFLAHQISDSINHILPEAVPHAYECKFPKTRINHIDLTDVDTEHIAKISSSEQVNS